MRKAIAKGNKNVNESEIGSTGKITMPKLEQKAPADFTLEFTANGDGTFTATIPKIKGAVYSFDNKNFSEENTKTDCAPNTQYTGYAKFPEDDTHYDSPVTASTETSPKLTAETPVISPDGGKFIGSQRITITCPTEGVKIYYTTDGSDPSNSSTEYTDGFTIDTAATVKAIATRDDLNDSEIVSAEFSEVTAADIQSKLTIQDGIPEVPESLKDNETFNSTDKIRAELTKVLTQHPGYTYLNMAFYDITLQISLDGENWEDATVDNFPDEGITIVIPYPEGTGKDTHDFIAAHMFTASSERLHTEPGQIEEPVVTRVDEGLQFTVMGTSPIGIAWKDLAQGGNPDSTDPDNEKDQEQNKKNPDDDKNKNINPQNDPTKDNTTTTKDSDAKSDNKNTSDIVSSVLPKTGDPMSFLPWIAAIVICLIVVVGILNKKKR